jgi:hydrogenase maturation factor
MSRPGRVLELRDGMAEVDLGGRRAWFNALMVPGLTPGAWVLTHTSLVISEISESDARAVEALIREVVEAQS